MKKGPIKHKAERVKKRVNPIRALFDLHSACQRLVGTLPARFESLSFSVFELITI